MNTEASYQLDQRIPNHSGKLFIDVFAGCGGLSLGLANAGWTGYFAIEKHPHAFDTLKTNLIDSQLHRHYMWPQWLPLQNFDIQDVNRRYRNELCNLRSIKLVVSGPPCQGFSLAGRRKANDKRNLLLYEYLEFIQLVKPEYLILENVRGITTTRKQGARGRPHAAMTYADLLRNHLEELGYLTQSKIFEAFDFGVPQRRPRFIMIGMNSEKLESLGIEGRSFNPFDDVDVLQEKFLAEKKISRDGRVGPKDALSDLELGKNVLIKCIDSIGFQQVKYSKPLTSYQKLMREGMDDDSPPNSLRLVKHRPHIKERFAEIIKYVEKNNRRGISLSPNERKVLGVPKRSLAVLHPDKPTHTVTTIPDDLLHYQEPRVLTVRENARLQSFPDWFKFTGTYTTGQHRRKVECPRYTQVGNAVPPLLAEFLGRLIDHIEQQLFR